jgi:RHS repeat-associated protein
LRDSRTVGGNTTTFTWDIAGGLPVVLGDGNQYVYGAGLVSQKQGGSWYYYLADGLRSTMAVVNASGTVQDSYTYDVYGTPTKTGSLGNEFDFAGQQTDGTGLQYLRARCYDPATGTFLSRDPLNGGQRWLGTSYGYASGNAPRFEDPTGLFLTAEGEGGNCRVDECNRVLVTVRGGDWKDVAGILLDTAAVLTYGTYYTTYQALGLEASVSADAGPLDHVLDLAALPATIPLTVVEGAGLGGDVAIDAVRDATGVDGQGIDDEGYVGCVLPDFLGCGPKTYLPGVHPGDCVQLNNEKSSLPTCSTKVDFNWPINLP